MRLCIGAACPVIEGNSETSKLASMANVGELPWETVNHEDLVNDILQAGRKDGCSTIVVGRESFSWLKEMFHHHVADELVRKAHGLTIWVVE